MQIEERNNFVKLFDTYGKLLSAKQREVMDKYLNLDFGESELAEAGGLTRQSVHDAIKKAKQQLLAFEEKCGVVTTSDNCKQMLKTARELIEKDEAEKAVSILKNIEEIL